MLTNQEALDIIKRYDECCVVWATDQNSILAVQSIPTGAKRKDRMAILDNMTTGYDGPTKGRFLTSSQMTIEYIAEAGFVLSRIQSFISWTHLPIEGQIDILCNSSFDEPMDPHHGSNHLVEQLYKIHGSELIQAHLSRLEQFAFSETVEPQQHGAQKNLQCYLTALNNEPERLKEMWKQEHHPDLDWSAVSWADSFMCAACDLETTDQDLIDFLIYCIDNRRIHGVNMDAMWALGKIGKPAGIQAVNAIIEQFNQSDDHWIDVANKVIARIESSRNDWSPCPKCYHGYTRGMTHEPYSVHICGLCLGIGYVRKYS